MYMFHLFQAWHVETDSGVGAEVEFYRYWSERGRFISVTTSTVNLRVEQYAVFTVRTNFFVQNINYLVSYNVVITAPC